MPARRRRHSAVLLSFITALTLGSAAPAVASDTGPALTTPSQTQSQSLTATSISLTVDPTSGDTQTAVKVVAHVDPIPTSGQVRLSDWTAESGGSPRFDELFDVKSNGNANIPGGVQLAAGEHWWQAEYLGDAHFAPSGPSARVLVTITGIPSTISHVSIDWGNPIQFSALGGQGKGDIQLVVDGQVHSSCLQMANTAPHCTATNNLPRGSHQVTVRYVPDDPWAPSQSSTYTYANDPALPPTSGIVVDRDTFSTNQRQATISAAAHDNGLTVSDVLLSNDSAIGVDGLLVDGVQSAYAPEIDWNLAAGPDGLRTVWAQFHLSDDSWTGPYSDSIHLDTTPPSGQFVINDDAPFLGDPWTGSYDWPTLSGTVSDDLLSAGGGISYVAVSNDGQWWATYPFDATPPNFSLPDWPITGYYGESGGGPRKLHVYMKWRDSAGNWSTVATDTINLDSNGAAVGTLLVDGTQMPTDPPLGLTSDPSPMVTIHVDFVPPDGLDHAFIYLNEGGPRKRVDWPADSTELTVPWSVVDPNYGYTRGDGLKTIHVDLVSTTGMVRAIGVSFVLDRVVATTTKPVPLITLDGIVAPQAGASGAAFAQTVASVDTTIGWSPTNNVGVASYNLQHTTGSAWTPVALSQPKATSVVQSLTPGASNQYRLSSTAKSGATSDWKSGPTFTIVPVDDSDGAVTFTGNWRSTFPLDALGETLHSTTAKGAAARLHFHGRGIAIVAPRSSAQAIAKILINGRLIKSVYFLGSAQTRDVVFTISWKKSAARTIKVVKKYASGTLTIDAFLILS